MPNPDRISLSTLRQGAAYILIGLLWGIVIPKTPFPRLALGAHIQLTAHGVMFLTAGLVIAHRSLGSSRLAAAILTAAPWLTWPVMLTEMANAFWGTHDMLPIAAAQAQAPGAAPWQEAAVTLTHIFGALVLIAYWGTILRGLFTKPAVPPIMVPP